MMILFRIKASNLRHLYPALATLLLVGMLLGMVGCLPADPTPTHTLAPIQNPSPTHTPLPTATATLAPTATPTREPTPLWAGESVRTLVVEGQPRTYYLYTPPDLTNLQALPVVFLFHGAGDSAKGFKVDGMRELADAHGFLLLTPQGVDAKWETGEVRANDTRTEVDDLAFVRAMLVDLETFATLDMRRIYSAGFSNGAMFSYHLACNMADTFAAIAPLAGLLTSDDCQPSEPVSVLHVHGLSDESIEFEGDLNRRGEPWPPIMTGLEFWAGVNACELVAEQDQLEGGVAHTVFPDCQAGFAVELYTIETLGHKVPNLSEFPLAEVMWAFFESHPKP